MLKDATAAAVLLGFLLAGGLPAAAEPVVIKAERIFTGQAMLENAVIVIEDGLIRQVVPAADFKPLDGARHIDAAGMTVAPGLIDAHVHILSPPLPYLRDVAKHGWGRLAEQAVSRVPANRMDLLTSGITTVFDMGSPPDDILGLREDLRAGRTAGPELYACGPLFTAPNGHPAGTIYRGQHQLIDTATLQVDSREPAMAALTGLAARGVDFIKLVYDDGRCYGSAAPRLDPGLARELAAGAHAAGLKAIVHLGADEAAFADMLEIGSDGLEHCFAWNGSEEVFRKMAARGVFFTPTLAIYEVLAPEAMPGMQRSVQAAFRSGVTVVAGSDFPTTPFMQAGAGLYRELALLEGAGLSRLEALKAATFNAARKLGKEGEIGSIAAGRRANLVFFDGDVMRGELSPGRVRRVIQHGRPVVEDGKVPPERRDGFARRSIIVAPFGFYDPTAGFSLGLNLIHFNPFDSGAAASISGTYSFNNYFGVDLAVSPPSPIPSTGLSFSLGYDGYPKRFFGMSNEASLDDAAVFGARNLRAAVQTKTSLAGKLALNAAFFFDYRAIDAGTGSRLPAAPGGTGGPANLLKVELARDLRDAPGAPWYGDYEALSAGISHPLLGSAYSFQNIGADFRLFFSFLHGHVLAGRALYRQSFGDAPFYLRPDFGGPAVGRGFQPGRFIGSAALAAQLEYRFPLWAIMGGTLFFDAGQVRDDPTAFAPDKFHPSAGLGLRFAFSDQSILAFDFGFNGEPLSREGFTFMVRNGHAF